MPPRPFVNDALWRCLCPRWTQVPMQRDTGLLGAGKKIPSRPPIRSGPLKQPSRTYNTAAAAVPSTPTTPAGSFNGVPGAGGRLSAGAGQKKIHHKNTHRDTDFVNLSNEQLYNRLRIDAAKGLHPEVMSMLRILIKDRRERPNLAMYTALLHSYVSPEWGTAGKIRKALEDMAAAAIEPDARACECALEALAVHPDSFLRTDFLNYMRERWWTPTPSARCFIVAGLLRERCFEMALESLESMINEGVQVHAWLWNKAIWMLLEFGEVEEAFHVLSLKRKTSNNANGSSSGILWSQLLDVAGQRQIPEAASMIWYSHVVTGYLRPTTGTCLNVLSVAARVGDVKLATDVFRVLAERNTVFNNHHYEALIQCYLVVHDLPAALSVVLIMQESSLKVTEEQLHPLFAYLSRDKERPMNAFMQLQDLERSGRKIPTAAVNICIAASIKLGNLQEAIEFYKALKTVAKAGPTAATFNELFRGCYRRGRKELAMYLANEMVELDIRPDRLTYDRLILTCLHAGDVDDAISYFEEMKSEGMLPRRGTHEDLIERTLKAKDPRCVALLNWYKTAEYRVEARFASLHRLVSKHFEEGGERKKKITEGENVQDAFEAMEGKWSGNTDLASKKEQSAHSLLEALQEEMGGSQTGAGTKTEAVAQTEGTGEVHDASVALPRDADPEPQPQPESQTPDHTKFHI